MTETYLNGNKNKKESMNKSEIEKVPDVYVANKMCSLYGNAQRRGVDFELSFAKLKKVMHTKKCYFTGAKLNRIDGDPNQLSIDRLDNNVGYVDGNIVACARSFNEHVKNNLTVEQVKQLYNGLRKANIL